MQFLVEGVFVPVFTPIAVNNRPAETSHQITGKTSFINVPF